MTFGDMFVVWFSGLRGAMAFALALGKETVHGEALFTTTLIVVLVTVIIMGGSTVPLLEALGIRLDGSAALALSFEEQVGRRRQNRAVVAHHHRSPLLEAIFHAHARARRLLVCNVPRVASPGPHNHHAGAAASHGSHSDAEHRPRRSGKRL
jgi:hypothetical protein